MLDSSGTVFFKKQDSQKRYFCPNLPLDTKNWSVHELAKILSPKKLNKKMLNQFYKKTFHWKSSPRYAEKNLTKLQKKLYQTYEEFLVVALKPLNFSAITKFFRKIRFSRKFLVYEQKGVLTNLPQNFRRTAKRLHQIPKVFTIINIAKKILFQKIFFWTCKRHFC